MKMKIFHFIILLNFIILIYIPATFCDRFKIHEFMTEEEKAQTFESYNSNGSIPEYEIIRIWYEKTSDSDFGDNVDRLVFGTTSGDKSIDLKPVEQSVVGTNTPIWMARWKKNHMEFERLSPITMGKEIQIYETSENNTIVGSSYDENGVRYFAGYIGDLTISPLIKSVTRKAYRLKRRSVEARLVPGTKDPSGKLVLSDYHILYTSSKFSEDSLKASVAATKNIIEKSGSVNITRKSKRQAFLPVHDTTIYPEILLYTDYGMQFVETRGLLFNRFIIYLIAFWNSVNMFYKSLENPRITLKITGIVIGTAPFDSPFLEQNTNRYNQIYDVESLRDMAAFMAEKENVFSRDMYDIAVAMTERKLCIKDPGYNSCSGNTLGIARVGAPCVDDWSNGMTMVAIIHDSMDFRGLLPATHELAHVMGLRHDGTSGERNCDQADVLDNYIMTPRLDDRHLRWVWSNCSRIRFTEKLADNVRRCLRQENMAWNGYPTTNILPGQIMDAESQCKDRGYNHACNEQPDICESLKCWTEGFVGLFSGWKCKDGGPAWDGTKCGPNKYCNARKCVERPKRQSSFMDHYLKK